MLPFWNLQKLTIFLTTTKSTLPGSLEISEISMREREVQVQSEDKDKDGRHLLAT